MAFLLPVTDDYPGLCLFFACLYALVPRVPKPYIVTTSAIFEPGTAATTTTHFSRFRDLDAFWAYRTDCRRRSFWSCLCGDWSKADRQKRKRDNVQIITEAWCTTKCHKPRTYVCTSPHPQTSCDLRSYSQHLHSS